MMIIFKDESPNVLKVQLDEGMTFNVKMNTMSKKLVNLDINSIITPKLIEQNLEYIEKIIFNSKEEQEEVLSYIDPQKRLLVKEMSVLDCNCY